MRLKLKGIIKGFRTGGVYQRVLEIPGFFSEFEHVLALIGPSGGGKSTLLRLLAGLELPEEGDILLDDIGMPSDEAGMRRYRASLGMVFQSCNLFPHMNALENVMLPLTEVHGIPLEEARIRALEIMDRLGVAVHQAKHPGQLSGGQVQRVAISRALAIRPRLLLFDEPTSALDPEMTAEVLGLIEELRGGGTPMILITHQMGFARRIADRVAYLSGGKILEEGKAAEFFERPGTVEARSFLEKVLAY